MLAEESSDGVGGVKILPGDGSPSPRDGGVCGSAAESSEGSSFLRCGGVRSTDGVRCAGFLPLRTGRQLLQAIGGDLAPAMPYGEAGMLTGAVLVYDIEGGGGDRQGRWQWFGTHCPEERKRVIISFRELQQLKRLIPTPRTKSPCRKSPITTETENPQLMRKRKEREREMLVCGRAVDLLEKDGSQYCISFVEKRSKNAEERAK